MTGSVALDVVIGLVFIYLLYSLLTSILQEIIATTLSFRAKILEKGIMRMLQDDDGSKSSFGSRAMGWEHLLFIKKILQDGSLAEKFYEHPLIKFLGEDKWYKKPSYLHARNFSKVIIDLLRGSNISIDDDLRSQIDNALKPQSSSTDPNTTSEAAAKASQGIAPVTARFLYGLWVDAQGDIEKFKELLEEWFDATMERTTGWYKRYNQVCLLVVGLVIAIIFNVDSIQIAKKLSEDPEARRLLVEQAGNFIKEHPTLQEDLRERKNRIDDLLAEKKTRTKGDSVNAKEDKNQLDSIYQAKAKRLDLLEKEADSLIRSDIKKANELLALGWSDQLDSEGVCHFRPNGYDGLYTIIGWILTALALSLGAPFWFDLLNKLMKLRGAVQAAAETSVKVDTSSSSSSVKVKRVG